MEVWTGEKDEDKEDFREALTMIMIFILMVIVEVVMLVGVIILAFCQKGKYESNGIVGLHEK